MHRSNRPDLLGCQFLPISSKHWTAKTTANFGGALAIITLVFVGVVLPSAVFADGAAHHRGDLTHLVDG